MKSIEPDINELEVIPGLRLQEVPHHAELCLTSGEDPLGQVIVNASLWTIDVHRVPADELSNFLGKLRRVSESDLVDVSRQETGDADSVDSPRRVRRWNSDEY